MCGNQRIPFYLLLVLSLLPSLVLSQTTAVVQGRVLERTEQGTVVPVPGANIYWLGTVSGTLADTAGRFSIPFSPEYRRLVVSIVGYRADTVTVTEPRVLRVILVAEASEVAAVNVEGQRTPSYLDYRGTARTVVMTEKELFKAACCNLSESFETTPSVDVSFTDAITGTRQIEMLGLAGTYSQITVENMPAVRGLTSSVGLTHIPGTWMDNIQVSKGVGSVANGYESITGQINVEYRKPWKETESRLFVNVYGNEDERFEANLNYRQPIGEYVSSLTLLNLGSQQLMMDRNGDRFLDLPLSKTANVLQRFSVHGYGGLEVQLLVQFVADEKNGGTDRGRSMDRQTVLANPLEYVYRMDAQQLRVSGKLGYVLPETHQSVGLQWAYADYRQSSLLTRRTYDGRERSGYLNLLYDVELVPTVHRIRLGLSYLYDDYVEHLDDVPSMRTERVPGAFAEYTYIPDETISVVAGLRADRHSMFGTFLTPRLHLRYAPDPDLVFRASAGRGVRTANVYAENIAFLASARVPSIEAGTGAYPFQQEVGWNFGISATRYFLWDDREGTIVLDFHRTVFDRQVVVNLDRHPQQVVFQNLSGSSFSNSVQAEVNFQPVERLDMRTAYRYLDVRQSVDGRLLERPFVAQHRAFVNFGYATEREAADEPQMLYDLTVSWVGKKRLPSTAANPEAYRVTPYSPSFFLVNGQVTRSLSLGLDLYLGVENLFDFRQDHPIVSAADPSGPYFDSSLIWGPVAGRMVYAGVRWRM